MPIAAAARLLLGNSSQTHDFKLYDCVLLAGRLSVGPDAPRNSQQQYRTATALLGRTAARRL